MWPGVEEVLGNRVGRIRKVRSGGEGGVRGRKARGREGRLVQFLCSQSSISRSGPSGDPKCLKTAYLVFDE